MIPPVWIKQLYSDFTYVSLITQNRSSIDFGVKRSKAKVAGEDCYGDPPPPRRVGVDITPITKAPPAQIFFRRHVFCSPGHELLISAMTLTFALKVKP